MVRLHVHGVKHLKLQNIMKNKKKKRDSISRGTETDFECVGPIEGASPDGSFSIWMGGSTSTPEKEGRSPAWYSRKQVNFNDHSAHSIVLFEETMISAKSKERLDLSPIKVGKDDPGSLTFYPSAGKVHFRVSDIHANDLAGEGGVSPQKSVERENEEDSSVGKPDGVNSWIQPRVTEDGQIRTNDVDKGVNRTAVSGHKEDIDSCSDDDKRRGLRIGPNRNDRNRDEQKNVNGHHHNDTSPDHFVQSRKSVLTVLNGKRMDHDNGGRSHIHKNNGRKDGKENMSPPRAGLQKQGRSRRGIVWSVGDAIFNDAMADLWNIGSSARQVGLDSGDSKRRVTSVSRSENSDIISGDNSERSSSSRSSIRSKDGLNVNSSGHRALADVTNKFHTVHPQHRSASKASNEREPTVTKPRTLQTRPEVRLVRDKRALIGTPKIESLRIRQGEFRYDDPYMEDNAINSRLKTTTRLPLLVPKGNIVFKSDPDDNVNYDSWEGSNINHRGYVNVEHIFQNLDSDRINPDIRPIPRPSDRVRSAGITSGGGHRRRNDEHQTKTSDFTGAASHRIGEHIEHRRRVLSSDEITYPSTLSAVRPSTISLLEQLKDGAGLEQMHDSSHRLGNVGEAQHRGLSAEYSWSLVAEQPPRVTLPGRFSLDGIRSSGMRRNKNVDTNAPLKSSSQLQFVSDGVERKVQKLMEFFENQSNTLSSSGGSISRRSCIPLVRSTSSVSSRITQFECDYSSPDTSRSSSFPGCGTDHVNVGKTSTSAAVGSDTHLHRETRLSLLGNVAAHRNRYATRQDGGVGSTDMVSAHSPHDHVVPNVTKTRTLSPCIEDDNQRDNGRISNNPRKHKTSRLTREAILLQDFPCQTKNGIIHFQRGEVVRVLSNWLDGQVRVKKYDDQTESLLPKKCLFFVSSSASLIGYCRHGQASKANSGPTVNQHEPDTKKYLLEPYLVVRPHIAEGSRQVTVLRGEVVVIAPVRSRDMDPMGWKRVYVPRTQGFGFIPCSVMQPLAFGPRHNCSQ